ncbi:MAG: PH domain-containing protein [Candidatus Lokiarchaeota archaeon]|nr:PH domain-containing protein [Candidatus Lokiarchaeota archaeon]
MQKRSENVVNDAEIVHEGYIEKEYVKKEVMKQLIVWSLVSIGTYITPILIFLIDPRPYPIEAWLITILLFIATIVIPIIIAQLYCTAYQNNFSYQISKRFILIKSGVFDQHKTTIPFSRIQNIAVVQGVFDRKFGLYTVKIETAGSHGTASAGGNVVKPEGYIPALKDPSQLENIIDELIHEYTQTPPKLKGKVFDNPDIAFDQFAAYFLEKIHGGGDMKNRLKELRNEKNLTQEELAEKVGVSRTTIYYLEAGKYLPSLKLAMLLAEELDVKITELFELDASDRKKA